MAKSKKFSSSLSTEDVLSLYRLKRDDADEGRIRRIATAMRSLCRLQAEPRIPPQYRAITRSVKTPFVRDAAHRITSSLLAKPPVVHVMPKDTERKDYREAAATASRADMALIERLNKERGQDINYNLTYQLVRDGDSVLKVLHRPEAWANFPLRESDRQDGEELLGKQKDFKLSADLPILWRDVDRMSLVYEGGEYGDDWVIEYGEYAKPYLKTRYKMVEYNGQLSDPARLISGKPMPEGLQSSASGITTKVEFFNADEWHVIIDGSSAPGFPQANPYAPYLPYFRASAYDCESLLYSLLFLVPRLDELLTMKLNWAYLGAYPIPKLETSASSQNIDVYSGPIGNAGDDAGNTPDQKSKITFSPGKFMEVPYGKTLSFLSPPSVGQDLNELVSILKTLIDTAGVPSIMRGVSGAGDSGYLANQLRAAAQMSYKLAMIALQRQEEKAIEFTHWLISHRIEQTVYVLGWTETNPNTGKSSKTAEKAWLGLSPGDEGKTLPKNVADLSKVATVDIRYRAQMVTDEQAAAMVALQLTQAPKPLYGRRHALETLLQEEDPDAILDEIAVEEALNQEPLKSMVIENALRDAGLSSPQPPAPSPMPEGRAGGPGMGAGPSLGPAPSNGPVPIQPPPGLPGQPGLNMPIQPPPPRMRSQVGRRGGRVAGAYPGRPGGPNAKARSM